MSGTAIVAVLAGLVFPGLGQGLACHRRRALLWASAVLVTMLLIFVSVWFVPVTLLLRIAAAVDAYRCVARHAPPHNVVNAALVVVIGAVGIGYTETAVEAFKIPSSSMYPTLIIGDHIFVDKLSLRWRPPERGELLVFTHPCSDRTYIKRVIARGGDTVEVRCSVVYLNGTALSTSLVTERDGYLEQDLSSLDLDDAKRRVETSRYRELLGGHAYDTFHSPARVKRDLAGIADEHGDFPRRDHPFLPSCSQGDFYDSKPAGKQPSGRFVETKAQAAGSCEPQLHFVVPPGALFVMGDNRNNASDSRYWGIVPEDAVIGRAIGIWMSDGDEGGWGRFGSIE